jgi:pyruvate formate lyase activating enzyme
LLEIIEKCRAEGINTAIETSLYIYDEQVFSALDLVMADLKIWDEDTHKRYTGVSALRIKENFSRLDKLGVPIIARTPVIPEIEQGIPEISRFLFGLDNVIKYELLPYHPLGESKRLALGLAPSEFTVPTKEFMKELSQYVFIRK